MPEAQEPVVVSTIPVIENTASLKVFYASTIGQIAADDWIQDTALICTGVAPTNGSQIGSASFSILPFDNDTTRAGYSDELAALHGTAQDVFNVNLSGTYTNPYFVKVTDAVNGTDFPVFYGYINSVTNDIARARCTCSALSYAGLLDQVGLLGSWWNTTSTGDATWFYHVEPVLNPNGMGNMSGETLTASGITGNSIDETLVLLNDTTTNRYTVLDAVNLVLLHMVHPDAILDDGTTQVNPWSFAASIYNSDLIEITPDAASLMGDSFAVDNYSFLGKTLWGALVELVESVDNLVITERITYSNGSDEKPRIYVTKGSI